MSSLRNTFKQLLLLILCLAAMSSKTHVLSSIPQKVALVGATGRLGQRTLDQLLERKIPVKCLIRQPSPPDFLLDKQKTNPDLLEFVTAGDVSNKAKIKELLAGCSHCLALHGATRRTKWNELISAAEASEDTDTSHAKQVNYKSMQTFIECAKETGCEHIVRITGKGEDPWSFFSVLINGFGSMAKGWNYEGEQVLRQQLKDTNKHLDYTIIRPGVMKIDFDPKESNVHLQVADNGGDLKVSAVSYDQIAELCVESLLTPQARNTTLTAMNVRNEETSALSIADQLKLVKKDTRDYPHSLIDEHKRAVKTVFSSLGAAFLAVVAVFFLRLFR
jgi:putative NADH-flavin reductase